jgi:hypothetical protein
VETNPDKHFLLEAGSHLKPEHFSRTLLPIRLPEG